MKAPDRLPGAAYHLRHALVFAEFRQGFSIMESAGPFGRRNQSRDWDG
jgi:hypothetical protein